MVKLNSWIEVRNCNLDESFVGVQVKDEKLLITFPHAYELGNKENSQIKKDILKLISIFKNYERKNTKISEGLLSSSPPIINFPIDSMLRVYENFLMYGYYFEREKKYRKSSKGKINWSKTIKEVSPMIQNNNAYYLDFIVQKKNIKQNSIITDIHKHCVDVSYRMVGWLIGDREPDLDYIKYPKIYMLNELYAKYKTTFNDRDKLLIQDMISIINLEGYFFKNENVIGTDRFEYIWESLIDNVFGITDKNHYFPKTFWDFGNSIKHNAPLAPDTIMIDDKYLVLIDAKYYKYGVTGNPNHLPGSSDISKQIVYGEYINQVKNDKNYKLRNIFLIPYNKNNNVFGVNKDFYIFGIGKSLWKNNGEHFEKIMGILVDVERLVDFFQENNHMAKELLLKEILKYEED